MGNCLDVCGTVDISGPVSMACDATNGAIYLFKGDKVMAGAYAIAVIPVAGLVTKNVVKQSSNLATEALQKEVKKAVKEAEEKMFNFADIPSKHMDEVGRQIPVYILSDVLNNPLHILKDPQGTSAKMYYSRMERNGKLYNVEVLYNQETNTIWHFKYSQDPIGPLSSTK